MKNAKKIIIGKKIKLFDDSDSVWEITLCWIRFAIKNVFEKLKVKKERRANFKKEIKNRF